MNPIDAERDRRAGLRLSLPAGGLLALCLFLPAIESCHKPFYPYEAPLMTGPYLLGLTAALWGALRLWAPASRAQAAVRWVHWLAAVLSPLPLLHHLLRGVEGEARRAVQLWLVLLWLVPLAVLMSAPRLRRDPERFVARCHLAAGAQGLAWFHHWLWAAPLDKIYYGFWLSLAASAALLLSGTLLDRPAETEEPAGGPDAPA